jgi:hypothetical protein
MAKLKKLTAEQVREAIHLYESGCSLEEVGKFYGVTRQAVHDLFTRRGVKMRPQLRFGADNHFYRGGPSADPKVWNITEKAIARGVLVPQPCEVCGAVGQMADGRNIVQAHHDDYNKPLQVRWLCQEHHHEWHQHNKPIQRLTVQVADGKEGARGAIDVVTGGFPSSVPRHFIRRGRARPCRRAQRTLV